jgi:transposase
MSSMTRIDENRKVIVGVDTHKSTHVAFAISDLGTSLGTESFDANTAGYGALIEWSRSFGEVTAVGIEGTGSYGAGLESFIRRQGIKVVECNQCDRRKRRRDGKTDTLDAEVAARSVLAGTATAIPKHADGAAEMVREIKIAKDTAVKARSAAIITLKTLVVNAPAVLREQLSLLGDRDLIETCAAMIAGPLIDTDASIRYSLRALALRFLLLEQETNEHEKVLDLITADAVPTLRDAYGIGPDCAAEMMIVVGDNPDRIRSEAAFAKLVGVCPIPASSGVTNRHRLYRGGHRQANAAIYRTVIVRLRWHQPTIEYVARRTAEGLSKKDIIRCLKRYVAREIYSALIHDHHTRNLLLRA